MTILLNRSYAGYAAGATVELSTDAEAALIAQGLASNAADNAITTGNAIANTYMGTAAIPAGSSSVVITNSNIDKNSKVFAVVAQAAADGTLLRVERVLTASGASAGLPGTITIYGTANATATTFIDWIIVNPQGQTVRN
jgi:hypothetical protein